VLNRRGVDVSMRSPHADITTGRKAKDAFPDVVTLHAPVSPPSEPGRTGTDIALAGVQEADVDTAKRFFLRYSQEPLLESIDYGDVPGRAGSTSAARIYVKGLFVAEEPDSCSPTTSQIRSAAPGA
jgi:hypothetical protein